MKELEAKRDLIVIEEEDKVTNYYRIKQQLQKLEKEMQTHITKPIYCVPFLQPGRLVKVEHDDEDFGWGCIVNFQKKANQKVYGRGREREIERERERERERNTRNLF